MQSNQLLKIRIDNVVPFGLIDAKGIPALAINPIKLVSMIRDAAEGNIRLLEVLTFSFKETPEHWQGRGAHIGEAWKKLNDKLSDQEKLKCKALQQDLKQLGDIAEGMLTAIDEKKLSHAKIIDEGCQKLEAVLSKVQEEKQQNFTHIEMDSVRLTVLISNLFLARKHLLTMENHKDQKDNSDRQLHRFFQKPTDNKKESTDEKKKLYSIPRSHHQIWMGSKLPHNYLKNKCNLAKRVKQCTMNCGHSIQTS